MTIAENITSIGQEAFGSCSIENLYYNAIDAEIPGMQVSLHNRNPFASAEIGELHIGDKVRVLPDSMFYQISLTQDELTLPDSITYVGYDVLSCANDNNGRGGMSIGTLVIGENVTHIGRAAFGAATYDKVIIRAVETGNELLSYDMEVPACGSVEIHGNADSYDYFTKNTNAGNITLLCEDFETTYGDEYFDEDKSKFVTPVTDTCTVCGYEVESEEHEDGYTVTFVDYDRKELSKQHVKRGANATVPEEPTRPSEEWGSWKFIGWEGNYENVMKDEIVQAQFEKVMNEYEVIFYDADGNELSRQKVTHGQAATPPKDPVKEADDKYTYTFAGWDGDYDFITEDTVIYALFERHEIPETGDKGDEGEPEQENPESGGQGGGTAPGQDGDSESGGQGSGTAPGQDSDSNQETGSGNELGNPGAGTSEDSGGQTEEPDLSTAGRIFREAMPAPGILDWIFNDTASAAEEEPEEIPEKYKESDIVENGSDTADMADTDDADDTDDRQDLTVPNTGAYRRDNSWPTWLMLLLGMIAAGAFLICLYLILRNRKAYGIILNVYGSPECGAQITMIDKDMPESEMNKNDCLRIDGLNKDDYRLKVTQKKGYRMLSVDIFMENRDKEETFTILES